MRSINQRENNLQNKEILFVILFSAATMHSTYPPKNTKQPENEISKKLKQGKNWCLTKKILQQEWSGKKQYVDDKYSVFAMKFARSCFTPQHGLALFGLLSLKTQNYAAVTQD